MGNFRRRPLADSCRNMPAADRFRRPTLDAFSAASDTCRTCRWRHVCARCPALVEKHAGSKTDWNPQACQTLVHWSEVERRARELGMELPA
jgi:radical SAM protein with 4Fe4S-binding SPASM domain